MDSMSMGHCSSSSAISLICIWVVTDCHPWVSGWWLGSHCGHSFINGTSPAFYESSSIRYCLLWKFINTVLTWFCTRLSHMLCRIVPVTQHTCTKYVWASPLPFMKVHRFGASNPAMRSKYAAKYNTVTRFLHVTVTCVLRSISVTQRSGYRMAGKFRGWKLLWISQFCGYSQKFSPKKFGGVVSFSTA